MLWLSCGTLDSRTANGLALHDRPAGALGRAPETLQPDALPAAQRLPLLAATFARMRELVLITDAGTPDDPEPRIVDVNPAFERRSGYRAADLRGRSPRLLQGPLTSRIALGRLRAAVAAGQPLRTELVIYTRTAQACWIELDLSPVTDAGGRLSHWLAIQRDLGERRPQESVAADSARKQRLLAEAATRILDARGLVATLQMITQTARAVIGAHDVALRLGDARDTPLPHPSWETREDVGRERLAAPLRSRDGRQIGLIELADKVEGEFTDEDATMLAQIGQLAAGAVEIMRLLDRQLADSERLQRTLTDAAPQIVWFAAPDGSVRYLNRHWSSVTGRGAEEALGWGWLDAVHPEDVGALQLRWSEAVTLGERYHGECRIQAADGSYRHLRAPRHRAPSRPGVGGGAPRRGGVLLLHDSVVARLRTRVTRSSRSGGRLPAPRGGSRAAGRCRSAARSGGRRRTARRCGR